MSSFRFFLALVVVCSTLATSKHFRSQLAIAQVDTFLVNPYFFVNQYGQVYSQFTKSGKTSVSIPQSAKKHSSRLLADEPTKAPTEAMDIKGWLLYNIYSSSDSTCSQSYVADAALAVGVCLSNTAQSSSIMILVELNTESSAVEAKIVTHSFSDKNCLFETAADVETVQLDTCADATVSTYSPYSGAFHRKLIYVPGASAPLSPYANSGLKTTFVDSSDCSIDRVVEQSTISPDYCFTVTGFDDAASAKVFCNQDRKISYIFFSDDACVTSVSSTTVDDTVCTADLVDTPYGDYYDKYYKQTCL